MSETSVRKDIVLHLGFQLVRFEIFPFWCLRVNLTITTGNNGLSAIDLSIDANIWTQGRTKGGEMNPQSPWMRLHSGSGQLTKNNLKFSSSVRIFAEQSHDNILALKEKRFLLD